MAIYVIVVPKDNMLRQINDLVDFSFIHEELENKYCLDNGRNAVPPIRMFKYSLLKSIFDLSDMDIVERSKYDMSFKYFLDMAPEDEVIHPSSLTNSYISREVPTIISQNQFTSSPNNYGARKIKVELR